MQSNRTAKLEAMNETLERLAEDLYDVFQLIQRELVPALVARGIAVSAPADPWFEGGTQEANGDWTFPESESVRSFSRLEYIERGIDSEVERGTALNAWIRDQLLPAARLS